MSNNKVKDYFLLLGISLLVGLMILVQFTLITSLVRIDKLISLFEHFGWEFNDVSQQIIEALEKQNLPHVIVLIVVTVSFFMAMGAFSVRSASRNVAPAVFDKLKKISEFVQYIPPLITIIIISLYKFHVSIPLITDKILVAGIVFWLMMSIAVMQFGLFKMGRYEWVVWLVRSTQYTIGYFIVLKPDIADASVVVILLALLEILLKESEKKSNV